MERFTLKKICVVIGSRANYSSIKSVMRAIDNHPALELQVVLTASAILDRYGNVAKLIRADGFIPAAEVHTLIEGETPSTMAKSTGLGLIELATQFEQLEPDIVLTIGDRFETMATTLAAVYMNITVAHTMGGEVTGTIDESIRHAVTKFAHIHFPVSEEARQRILKLGEREQHVHMVGCPRIDLVAEALKKPDKSIERRLFNLGVGESFDIRKPFVVMSQHPVTTEYGDGERQITATLEAVREIGIPAIVLWPNADAGSEDISRGIRKWREQRKDREMHFFKNLPTDDYIYLMKKTSCLIGNSSSGIREGAYIGTPVVNIGLRQSMRERGRNVIDVPYEKHLIVEAINQQLAHGPYASQAVYGNGTAGIQIANILASESVEIQKQITY